MNLSRLIIDKEWFKDTNGRTIILRGVNLGGDCKVPYEPNGMTHIPTDFSNHRDVSFIGRPFPLDKADEHFSRLKAWGFNCLRLLITWEAVEHRGPGEYDAKYLDYYAKLCQMAGEYGLYVFVDFHQDVWSRMTGGDGAPCWLFEKIGIDYTKLSKADAALVMQHAYDFSNPRPIQKDNYPPMCWSTNYKYPGNAIMWTLFFAGKDFATNFKIDGENVQHYMQKHYFNCLNEVGRRIKDLPNVMGFDSLNEPSSGWIGIALEDRHLYSTKEDPAIPGLAWSPIDGLYMSHGFSVDIPNMGLSILKGGFVPRKTIRVNPNKVSIWIDNKTDPFLSEGAYRIKADNSYEILKNDFFQVVNGTHVNFDRDYMIPFIRSVAENIREINSDWFIFGEKSAKDATFDATFASEVPDKFVNATHWYDIIISGTKRVLYPVTIDAINRKVVFGKKGIQKTYIRQLSRIKNASKVLNQPHPTLIGEFGILYDLYKGRAFKKWAKGDHSEKIWKKHSFALDLMYNSMDALFLNCTQWNYNAHDRNDLRIGDGWNQEDCSIFSEDQRINKSDINSGARAIYAFLRPFARTVQGRPLDLSFNRKTGVFKLIYEADASIKAPTEVFVPALQYPNGYDLKLEGSELEHGVERDLIRITAKKSGRVSLTLTKRS